MKLVYLAGKITGRNCIETFFNRLKSFKYSKKLYGLGYIIHSPHIETMFNAYKFEYDDIINRDKYVLAKCDIVAFMPNWIDSKGAKIEMNYAKELKKEIMYL